MADTTDAGFKKTYQTVTKNETTGLDYQDSLVKDPPKNVEDAPYESKDGHLHDLANKGYSTQPTKEQAEEMAEMRTRLHSEK